MRRARGVTDDAHNVVLVGAPGTGKTHLATAIGVSGITRHGKRKRARFYSTVDLVNALEQEKAQGKAERIALSLRRMDLWMDHLHPDDHARSAEIMEEYFAGRSARYDGESRMRHRDNHWVWILGRGRRSGGVAEPSRQAHDRLAESRSAGATSAGSVPHRR